MKFMFAGAAALAILAMPLAAQETAEETAPATDVTAETVLATVNGADITVGHIVAMREVLPAQYQQLPETMLFSQILEQLIQQQVIASTAQEDPSLRMQLGLENERRAFLAGTYLDEVSSEKIPEEEIEAAYEAAYVAAGPSVEFNASHILVASEEEAQALIDELAEGADFAELAAEHSIGPTGPNGGNLGWFQPAMMVPEFGNALLEMEIDEVSAPVQTQFGWHVILLNDIREIAIPALEDVRTEIIENLRRSRVDARFEELLGAAEITLTDIEVPPGVISDDTLLDE